MSNEIPRPGSPDEIPAPPSAAPVASAPSLPKPWGLWDLILFIVFAVFASVISVSVVWAGYAALRGFLGWHLPSRELQFSAFFLLALQAIFHALILGYVYMLIVVHYRRSFWSALNWRKLPVNRAIQFFLGGMLLALAVQYVPVVLPDKQSFPLERMFSSPGAAYATGLFAVLIAPFMEEMIFRGVLFAFFEQLGGLVFAIVLTAVLFGAMHLPEYRGAWNHLFLILMVGLVFSLARGLTGSLVPSVILHTAYNLTLMLGLYVGTQHFRTLETLAIP